MKYIKPTILTLTLALATGFTAANAAKTTNDNFSDAQKQQIEKIIHNYLVTNPAVLIEASKALQEQEMAKAQQQAQDSISQNFKQLFLDPNSPVLGNPKGSIIMVEFMDYQCHYCKKVHKEVEKLIKNNPNLRVVIKEWPILSEASKTAAKAAIAAMKQDKFAAFHNALMTRKDDRISDDQVMEFAKQAGLNVDQLKKDMNDPAVAKEIESTTTLAKSLSLGGTPAFIISNVDGSKTEFVPGFSTEAALQDLINNISKG